MKMSSHSSTPKQSGLSAGDRARGGWRNIRDSWTRYFSRCRSRPTMGHEQRGIRPCVVVSDPEVAANQRFPLICVVPVTGTSGQGLLYPPLSAGKSGLAKESFALIDQLRVVNKRRVKSLFGQLPADEMDAMDEGLAAFLGLRSESSNPLPGLL
ncbi:MAG: type II toxin-antitoxin system PemK/MazF family toxin [Candidatus Solibacter sp.]